MRLKSNKNNNKKYINIKMRDYKNNEDYFYLFYFILFFFLFYFILFFILFLFYFILFYFIFAI